MNKINNVVNQINTFLQSIKTKFEIRLKDGYFISLKKHISENELFLEIHTPGYDGILPAIEAVEWLKWEVYDAEANGLI